MNGVDILATEEVAVDFIFNWTSFWICGGIILGIVTAVGLYCWLSGDCNWTIVPIFFVIGLIFGTLFGCGIGAVTHIPTKYTTEYKITISDEVLMNEFNEKYEIIDQDGKIFTVRERE